MSGTDYLPQLVEELRKQGATQDAIERFSAFYRSRNSHSLPCPFCYVQDGTEGVLVSLPAAIGNRRLLCKKCKQEFTL